MFLWYKLAKEVAHRFVLNKTWQCIGSSPIGKFVDFVDLDWRFAVSVCDLRGFGSVLASTTTAGLFVQLSFVTVRKSYHVLLTQQMIFRGEIVKEHYKWQVTSWRR